VAFATKFFQQFQATPEGMGRTVRTLSHAADPPCSALCRPFFATETECGVGSTHEVQDPQDSGAGYRALVGLPHGVHGMFTCSHGMSLSWGQERLWETLTLTRGVGRVHPGGLFPILSELNVNRMVRPCWIPAREASVTGRREPAQRAPERVREHGTGERRSCWRATEASRTW
jgi:hypothetical protein